MASVDQNSSQFDLLLENGGRAINENPTTPMRREKESLWERTLCGAVRPEGNIVFFLSLATLSA
jgi:hypothetical protein